MGSPSELSLDYKPSNYLAMQKQQGGQPEQTQKIREFLARLEEERFKIEAFKRELPLCMQLLDNAVDAYRQQLEAYQTSQGPQPVLEEFIPLKNVDGSDKATNASSEKASWMVSAQLWSPANEAAKQSPGTPVTPPGKDVADHGFDVVVSPKLALDAKQRNGGAFLPFSKEKNKGLVAGKGLPEGALASPPEKLVGEKKCMEVIEINGSNGRRENGTIIKGSGGADQGGKVVGGSQSDQGQVQTTQPHRKARRCWSPDLHRRFVNALQILGGSHVATPKQIRELMKVDGLTNDEVKSHLQKYRLHTRRPIPAPPAPAPPAAPQLVVLGGIWVAPEYATSAAGPAAIYGAHPTPAHYCAAAAAALPQEYYPPPLHAHHPHHHHVHRPALHRSASVHVGGYKGRVSSAESEGRSGAEQSESVEEDERREGEEREDEEETEAEEDEEDVEANKSKAGATAADEKPTVPLPAKADDGGLKF